MARAGSRIVRRRLSSVGGVSGSAGTDHSEGGAMGSMVAAAEARIREFETMPGITPWRHITRDDLIWGLCIRVANPDRINTSAVNLCGPGAFFRCLAIDDPVMYADAVIDLWQINKAKIGSRV